MKAQRPRVVVEAVTLPTADRSDRGSVMVLVVLAMVALLGMGALAVDVGILHTARAQCQNAADSGALACGGQMLSLGGSINPGQLGQITNRGVEYANYNSVLSTPVAITPADVTVDLNLKRCRVCVPRTTARGNPVPTYFARVLNRDWVDVSACATAEIGLGNQANCMKPWALPDAYDDVNGNGVYDTGDIYAKGVTSYGTNYRNNNFDSGVQLVVKQADPSNAIAPGQFFPIDLPIPDSPDTGGDRYRSNIYQCNSLPVSLGDDLVTENGNMVGPTKQGVNELIDLDPNAAWDPATNTITGSAYGSTGSPRIIRLPFFDPGLPPTSGRTTVDVTNIASLFVEGITSNGVVTGRILPATGTGIGTTPGALQSVRLVE